MEDRNHQFGVLRGLQFEFMTGDDTEKICTATVNDANDLTSAKLGLPNSSSECSTCGANSIRDCEGHFGVIKLPRTIYNPQLVREAVNVLNQICPACMSVKKDVRSKKKALKIHQTTTTTTTSLYNNLLGSVNSKLTEKFLKTKLDDLKLPDNVRVLLARLINKQVQNLKVSGTNKNSCFKKTMGVVSNQTDCKYCSKSSCEWYPSVKFKVLSRDAQGKSCIAVVAEFSKKIPRKYGDKTLSEVLPKDFWKFIPTAPSQNEKPESLPVNRMYISPSQAFCLLKQLKPEIIGKFIRRRELLFLSHIPVSPNCQRLMETHHIFGDGPRLSFDKCTKTYRGIFEAGRKVDTYQNLGVDPASCIAGRVQDCLSISKLRSNKNVNEDRPSCTGLKWLKEIILSKRSDNAFRMTMVGDPKIKLGEIGLPKDIADTLYVTEPVNDHNIENLRLSCEIHWLSKEELYAKRNGKVILLRRTNPPRTDDYNQLRIGDSFFRPLEDGDIILINRPPSIHPHSIIALSVKSLPIGSVVSVNPLCCAPLCGDFDGDCLHGYIPQSIQSRVELNELVSLDHQIYNFQDGKCLLNLTHDSLTAAYLLMEHEVFLNKFEMQQLEMLCQLKHEGKNCQWTGKQLFSMMIPSDFSFNDSMPKRITDIVHDMFRCYGKKAIDYLYSIQDLLCEFLTIQGFSVSLSDIYMTSDNYTRKKLINEVGDGLEEAIDSCYYNQLLLDPETGFMLKSHDENNETFNTMDDSRKRRPVDQSSILKFKDVFRELQGVIHHYISRDNSILAMIHSGSKGSLLKLIQQSACLGVQLSSNPWKYQIPRKLTCSSWTQQRADDNFVSIEDGFDSYAVVKNSFLDGLNPLECFVHAISCRSNMFSDNAEVPGTLNRRIMYHMRDIYVAYDGTARNLYGQQVVQFSNSSHEDIHDKDCEYSEPSGALAACAISEAAYSALDQPINSLESSPLMSLKAILECAPPRLSMNRTATLVLSNKLEKLNYGFEYAALAVKSHLDGVYFSDVVSSVSILYEAQTHEVKLSPWVSHFHVNKETMRRKRITLQSIVDVLNGAYELLNPEAPRLFMKKQKCALGNEDNNSEKCCISVAIEDSSLPDLLDLIRDKMIPSLLRTLIKGFMEFKQVDILWDSEAEPNGQLVLKVAISKHCSRAKFWHTLVDACIPIMDLIDWEHSHPDGVYGIHDAFGIQAAWTYFVKNLKSAVSEIKKNVHLKHLLLVADALSVTGEFHGLSAKGISRQRAHTSISSPFIQACFSNPEKTFIAAGKESLVDDLHGTVDKMAWGIEAPVGTGGKFEIMYSRKVNNDKEPVNIYKKLLSVKDDASIKSQSRFNNGKWRKWSNAEAKEDLNFLSKYSSVRIGSWENVMDMLSSLRDILHRYSINDHLNEGDRCVVMEALMYHPRKDAKIGIGVKDIKVGQNMSHTNSRCFVLIRNDDSTEDFSFRKCVIEAARKISSELGLLVEQKLFSKRTC